jgi:hypothetical protein
MCKPCRRRPTIILTRIIITTPITIIRRMGGMGLGGSGGAGMAGITDITDIMAVIMAVGMAVIMAVGMAVIMAVGMAVIMVGMAVIMAMGMAVIMAVGMAAIMAVAGMAVGDTAEGTAESIPSVLRDEDEYEKTCVDLGNSRLGGSAGGLRQSGWFAQ